MSLVIAPPHAVLLLVGREEFTPPRSFGGAAAAATLDCSHGSEPDNVVFD